MNIPNDLLHLLSSCALASAGLAIAVFVIKRKRPSVSTTLDSTGGTDQYKALAELFDSLPNTVLNEELPIPVSTLWQVLFGTDVFMARFYHKQQYTNLQLHAWENNKNRMVTYTKRIKPTPFAPPEAGCIEHFLVIKQSSQGFVVNVAAVTPKVPFGENFHCQLQFVGESATPTSARLRVNTFVKFTKTTWLRGIIAKEAEAGMRETYKAFAEEMHKFVQERYPSAVRIVRGKGTKGGGPTIKAPAAGVTLLTAAMLVLLSAVVVLYCKVLDLEQQVDALLRAPQGARGK